MIRLTTIFALSLLLAACGNSTETKTNSTSTNLTTGGEKDEAGANRITVATTTITKNVEKEEFARLLKAKNGFLLDVRRPDEFDQGNIPGSFNHNILENTFVAAISNMDRSKPMFVYCKSGGRSSRAMSELKKLGFKEVYNLIGGYDGWTE